MSQFKAGDTVELLHSMQSDTSPDMWLSSSTQLQSLDTGAVGVVTNITDTRPQVYFSGMNITVLCDDSSLQLTNI